MTIGSDSWIRYKLHGISSSDRDEDASEKVVANGRGELGSRARRRRSRCISKESKPGKYTYTVRIRNSRANCGTDNNVATYNFQVVDKKVKVLSSKARTCRAGIPLPQERAAPRPLPNATFCWPRLRTLPLDGTEEGATGSVPDQQARDQRLRRDHLGDVSPSFHRRPCSSCCRSLFAKAAFMMIAANVTRPLILAGRLVRNPPRDPQRGAYQTPDGGFPGAVPVEPTAEGYKAPWMHLDPDEHANREIWENLPRLYWFYPSKKEGPARPSRGIPPKRMHPAQRCR